MLYDLCYFLNGASLMFFMLASIRVIGRARKSRSKPHLLFGACLLWMVLIEAKEFAISFMPYYDYEILGAAYTFPDLFTLPLMSLCFFELVMPGRVTTRYAFRLLAPFLVLMAVYPVAMTFCPHVPYGSFAEVCRALPSPLPSLLLLYVSYTIGYCVFALARIVAYSIRYAEQIAQAYSFSERIHLRWIRWMAAVLAFYLVSYVAIITFVNTTASSVFIFLLTLGVWGALYGCVMQYKIPTIIENYWRKDLHENDKEESRSREESRIALLRKSIDAAVGERRLYLDPGLTIVGLAAECKTNRTHLSHFFNHELGMSFRDFINRCRIEQAAIPLMEDEEKDYKVEEIALLSGFGSTSTFYRAFAKEKGITPQQWIAARKR